MDKVYRDTPDNFHEIEQYIILEPKEIVSNIIQAKKCYFYDACSFRKHMLISDTEYLHKYIKHTQGIVIITRCILMELCSNDNMLWREHVEYIKKMNESGITILVLYEEDIYDVVSACFASVVKINKFLSFAVRNIKSKVGTVDRTLTDNESLKIEIMYARDNTDSSLYKRFFETVRSNKVSGDNLGEELVAICIHILANIYEMVEYKYIFLTEDKGAISILGGAIKNVEKYIEKPCISAFTTTKLIHRMLECEIISTKEQVLMMLDTGDIENKIGIFCVGKYDLEVKEKTMQIEELAELLVNRDIWICL